MNWQSLKKGFRRKGKEEYTDQHTPLIKDEGPWCPDEKAGFFSTVFFTFMDGLMRKGRQKHLMQEDLWDLSDRNQVENISEPFHDHLCASKSDEHPQGSVYHALYKSNKMTVLLTGFLKFCHDLLLFVSPYIMEKLLHHMEHKDTAEKSEGHYWFLYGFLLALGLFFVSLMVSLVVNNYFYRLYRLQIHLRAQLLEMIYRKSVRISCSTRAKLGFGSIMNLQNTDVASVWDFVTYGHLIWSAPFQIIVALLLLKRLLGVIPVAAGFGATLLLFPFNGLLGVFAEKFREKMMEHTDNRVSLMTEVLAGMKAIKLYAWEKPYLDKMFHHRKLEIKQILGLSVMEGLMTGLFDTGPILISVAAFAAYWAIGGELTAKIAFPSLALFSMLDFPLGMLAWVVTTFVNAKVALRRIQGFMDAEEVVMEPRGKVETSPSIHVKSGSFSWDKEKSWLLENVNLDLKGNQLVIVVGEVGCGKSALLQSFMGEMHRIGGPVSVKGSIAYTSQDPWIQNMTVRENILMNKSYDEELYNTVISACGLIPDIDILPAGDATEIGERGINLSGGQKHRLALARACYMDTDICLFDDPLSAVDAQVGSQLFEECICGLLSDKLRILATHHVQYLPRADLIVVLEKGVITHMGTYKDLAKTFDYKFVSLEMIDDAKAPKENEVANSGLDQYKEKSGEGKLTGEEDREVGSVSKSVYYAYFKAYSPWMLLPILSVIGSFIHNIMDTGQSWWLSLWVDDHSNDSIYIIFYCVLGAVTMIASLGTAMLLVWGVINASKSMAWDMMSRMMRLPMSYFDTQPSGRMINRFSKDMQEMDVELMHSVLNSIVAVTYTLVSLLVVSVITRVVLIAVVVFALLYAWLQQRFIASTRELKRIDSIALSPIFSHMNSTVHGLETIRAFNHQGIFLEKNRHLINDSNRAKWPLLVANRWLAVRLEVMGSLLVFLAAVFSALVFDTSPGLTGLAITTALTITDYLAWMVRSISEVEIKMNSVERIMDNQNYEPEQAAIIPDNRPPASWPEDGTLTVTDLWVRYKEDLPPVLKGISFSINKHERVGICGRTGCGKSTLMMSLFRIIEPYAGSIVIDGIEALSLGLFDLRSKLSLVPQDPVIFSGTIRSNLDPWDELNDDKKLWEVLHQVGMKECVQGLEGALDAAISLGGQNFSAGQRQLLCMARALLHGSHILILDEATSSVDNVTDSLIQDTLRSAFTNCTVLTIAHRLRTIIDYDRIMVLDGGELLEMDTPEVLLKNPNSKFSQFMKEAESGAF